MFNDADKKVNINVYRIFIIKMSIENEYLGVNIFYMRKKILFILFFLLLALPISAGTYEDALKKYDNVFLYFYSSDCRTCKVFDSIYSNIQKENKNFGYVKVNVETPYGTYLMLKFRGRYVPYIILSNSKTKKNVNISHACVMDEMCLLRAMKSFKG